MRLPGFLTRNFRLKVACCVLAVITWSGVVYASNPPQTRLVSVHVPQQTSAIPAKYTLVHPVPDLQVRIGGTRSSLDAFNPSSLTLNVNWRAVKTAGVQQVPISITKSDPNIELVDPPTSITADIDSLTSTTVPVSIIVTNPPPAGYFIASETASPDAVIVAGPEQELSGLQARVAADLGNNKTNFVEDAPVLIYDSRGDRLSDLTVTPPPGSDAPPGQVKVTIIVSANITSRAAAVVPRTVGNVAPGHQYVGIVLSAPNVVLSGPQNLLNALDSVFTSTISLNGLTGDITVTVPVTPPAGVTASPSTVTVTILVRTIPVAPPPSATPSPTPSPSPSPTT